MTMSEKLFLKTIHCAGGTLTLELAVGTSVVLDDLEKRRDLPGGRTEHAVTVSRDGEHFDVRTVVDADGSITKVVASSVPIPDDWHERLETP